MAFLKISLECIEKIDFNHIYYCDSYFYKNIYDIIIIIFYNYVKNYCK